MKTLLRTLLFLALIVWLGAEIFFPIVAAVTFNSLPGATHAAGTIVGELLRILHGMGIVCGLVLLALLALAPAWHIFKPRSVLAPMVLVVLMLACTAYSQYGIIPAMERDRAAAGGAIDTADATNPVTAHFNMLHNRSEHDGDPAARNRNRRPGGLGRIRPRRRLNQRISQSKKDRRRPVLHGARPPSV